MPEIGLFDAIYSVSNMTISLAFLAPKLVRAGVAGRLPRGINIARLRDAPAEWIAFDALLFCCGDILRKGVELTFRRGAMHGEDVEERR